MAPIIKRAIAQTVLTLGVDPNEVLDEAADWADQHAGRLVTGLSASERQAVATTISRAVERGWDEQKTATAVRRVIGLGPKNAIAVQNMEQGLVANGVPPGRARIQANAYAKRLAQTRANTVAGHEVATAIAYGKRIAWQRRQQMGEISHWGVRVTHCHKDDRQCPTCNSMNGRRHSLKDIDNGPPWHIGCRCWEDLVDMGKPDVVA